MAGRIAYYGGIVRDGLVLDLDAAKRDSYPGSGITWFDISGNNTNFTLLSGSSFTQTQTGVYISGSSSATVPTPTALQSGLSVEFAIQAVTSSVAFTTYVGANSPGVYFRGSNGSTNQLQLLAFAKNTSNSDIFLFDSAGRLFTPGYWTILTATFSPTGTGVLYSRGVNVFSQTLTNFAFWNFNFNQFYFRLGLLANLRIYNRVLTATEILQNYNATKTRFGL